MSKRGLSQRVAIALMAQYPTNVAGTMNVICCFRVESRKTNGGAVSLLEELGMEEGWLQRYDGLLLLSAGFL